MTQRVMAFFLTVTTFLGGQSLWAENIFPVFKVEPIELIIPTNTVGIVPDAVAEKKGTNLIYRVKGQFITNLAEGRIQSTSGGFSGTSDKSNPWKTMTELFAVYQGGGDEAKMRSLYADGYTDVLDQGYKNPATKERFQKLGLSITNMQALAWHESEVEKGGSFAYVKLFYKSGRSAVMPYILKKSGENYELISKSFTTNSDPGIWKNVWAYLQSDHATNVFR